MNNFFHKINNSLMQILLLRIYQLKLIEFMDFDAEILKTPFISFKKKKQGIQIN